MKVLCDREKLREGLAIVNNVIPPRSTKPVLENVCFVATDNALSWWGPTSRSRCAIASRT